MIAHVTGVPVEETLLPLLSAMGAGLLMARAWVASRVRRPRQDRAMSSGRQPGLNQRRSPAPRPGQEETTTP
jgi:hypothetical protein